MCFVVFCFILVWFGFLQKHPNIQLFTFLFTLFFFLLDFGHPPTVLRNLFNKGGHVKSFGTDCTRPTQKWAGTAL